MKKVDMYELIDEREDCDGEGESAFKIKNSHRSGSIGLTLRP